VAHVQSVWDDSVELVEDLHREKFNKILMGFNEAPELQFEGTDRFQRNPLIEVYTGVAGAGKTQLLSPVRKSVMSAGKHFVLVDMTGVNSFYPTVCLHLVQSLLQKTPQGYLQIEHILANLVRIVVADCSEEEALRGLRLAASSSKPIEELVASISDGLNRTVADFARPIRMHFRSDVLRALVMLGLLKDDDRAEAAYDWLQGGELEEEQARAIKLPRKLPAKDIIQAVTAIMSLRAPTLLAFDQLDVIVNQFETAGRGGNSETAAAAKAAVIDIVGGLATLWEHAFRSQILVSCLQQTWETLKGNMQAGLMDRFHTPPIRLAEISHDEVAKKIVALRLQRGYHEVGFQPDYPTWPFADSFFEVGMTPRSLLQKCLAHREKCLEAGQVTETGTAITLPVPPPELKKLEAAFADLQHHVSIDEYVGDTDASESALGSLLDVICNLLIIENPAPQKIEAKVDLEAGSSSKSRTGLHARIHLTFLAENDREEFFCFRAILRNHANAFIARLRAAITDSGINLKLPFRRLVIVRNQLPPSGKTTRALVETLTGLGGRIQPLPEAELRVLIALRSLRDQKDPLFDSWLDARKPLRQLPFVRDAFKDYFTLIERALTVPEPHPTTPGPPPKIQEIPPETPEKQPSTPVASILVGTLLGPLANSAVELPLGALTRHVLIRAGSGGGKTVLLKRLVESAALSGVPSIVLDPGNDLAFLGDAWPSAPSAWLSDDAGRATAYHNQVEVVIWTPGRTGGRPLAFSPLPNFSAVVDDEDDFESAVLMAAGSLSEATGASKGAGSQLKPGVLTEAIRHFARRGGQTLPALVAFLSDLPPEVRDEVKISSAPKLAQRMADTLQATLLGNKALIPEGRGTSLSEVLGIGAKKTRVSVVSLAGLSETNGDRLAFVNQLAVELFTWLRKNPSKGPGHVKGLLVVDEARDFIPSVKSTPCKDSLMRVAAQARKYGFGLLMATQNPTDIDHKAAGQCATQFFGRAASPNVVDAMRQAIEERGGSASDLTQLGKGQFYFSSSESEKYKHPVRVQVPICLSYHPDGVTLTESEILIRARRPSNATVR
jgi:DNA helicase HerA-like ATPase